MCISWSLRILFFFSPSIKTSGNKYLLIHTGENYQQVLHSLTTENIISNTFYFNKLAHWLNYDKRVKPGRYQINNNCSIYELVTLLKSGNQKEIRFSINKLRTKEDFAAKIGACFEADSSEVMRFITSNDSLAAFQLDTNTVLTAVIPNSYMFWWNGSFKKIFTRLKKQHDLFWEGKRTALATELGLTPTQVYIIASIVEEETNQEEDKGKIASVYINRLRKNMKFEADPTVKYAMRNFGLKRILNEHLKFNSPYNTYQNTGIPSGPICTPSINTIEAVLNAPKTDYIFFVAKPDFNGLSNFSNNYGEHTKFAHAYQHALDSLLLAKKRKTN
jgi:UPF0755 protein